MKTIILWLIVGAGDLIYGIVTGSDFVGGFGLGLIVVSLVEIMLNTTK